MQGRTVDYIHIENWRTFQHYRDRNPPWIKFYVSILDDYDFYILPDNQKLILIHLWLLASKTNNNIPYDLNYIKANTKLNIAIEIEPLIKAGFIWSDNVKTGDSNVRATCYQSATQRQRQRREDIFVKRPKKCHRTGCNRIGTTYDYDDTGLIYWMCNDHKKTVAKVWSKE